VFNLVALANSKVGLKKVKFHAPKHFLFYIKCYGSSENFFGGSLESALKSTVKEPTEHTSRRHDYQCKELANQQHDHFCINQSRYNNRKSMESFLSSTANNNKRQKIDCDDTVSDLDTIMPDGWTMHNSVFFLTKVGQEWSTHRGKHTFPNAIVYPNIVSSTPGDVFESGEDVCVCAAIDKANKLGFCCIDILCGAIIPTKQVECHGGSTRDLFWCHPSFHSYPYL
jgi:hypothetical protein